MNQHKSPVIQAILDRRSIRKFTDQAVSREDLGTILEAARWAPSGKNRQPWRFLVLNRPDERKERVAALSSYRTMIAGAASLIVVVADREACYYPVKDHQSVGAALQNMLLAVHALGLGAVWIGQVMDRGPEVLAACGLDGNRYDFMALVALGHPAESGRSPDRQELDSLVLEPF